MAVIGWDIGGVNTKVACVAAGALLDVRSRPFELQRSPASLAPLLCELARDVGRVLSDPPRDVGRVLSDPPRDVAAPPTRSSLVHAVTMTAELSQMFRTKREGVTFVLDAVAQAFPGAAVRVFTTGGQFVSMDEARREPIAVAAANWAATAAVVA